MPPREPTTIHASPSGSASSGLSPTAAPGRYHGLLLVAGLTAAAEPVSLEVVADADAEDAGDHD